MTDSQKYQLLSYRILSKELQSEIIESVPGAFLTWLPDGDKDHPKQDSQGYYQYILNCSELTSKNEYHLTKVMLLNVVRVPDHQADLSAKLT